jgi:hypothetical protein
MGSPNHGGITYNINLSAASLTTANAWDVFTVTPDSSSRVELVSIKLQLVSTAYAVFPAIGVQVMRGSTTAASSGTLTTPVNVKGWTGAPTAAMTANSLSSSLLTTTSATVVYAGAFDANGSFCYEPCDRPIMATSQRHNVRLSVPQVGASVHGSMTVREIGKGLPT